jgi:hypothetical protein
MTGFPEEFTTPKALQEQKRELERLAAEYKARLIRRWP